MPLKLEFAQTVAIGAFNPYVVTPEWLVRFGFYPEGAEVNVRLVALGGGAAFEFGDVLWEVDDQHLAVSSSTTVDVDCGDMVSRVLKMLPHTPVRAVGHNFHFSATKEEWGSRPIPRLGEKRLEALEGVDQVRWSGSFQRGKAKTEVTLATDRVGVAILLNHHRSMNPELARRARRAEEQIAEAIAAAGEFQGDLDVSRALLKLYFEVEPPR